VLDGLEVTLAGTLAGALARSPTLHLDAAEIGLTASAYRASAVAGALLFGHLADRLGRKRLSTATLLVYLLGTAGSPLSWSFAGYAFWRMVTGAGIGGEYSAINSAIQEFTPPQLLSALHSWWRPGLSSGRPVCPRSGSRLSSSQRRLPAPIATRADGDLVRACGAFDLSQCVSGLRRTSPIEGAANLLLESQVE